MAKAKRVAIYLRVSTAGQSTERQRAELEEVAARAGWEVAGVFEDAGISGAKGRDKRPQFDAMLKLAAQRKVDIVASWSVDRLSRSLQQLVAMLGDLQAVGCDLYLHQQHIDTTTPGGKAMFQMLGVFAEFERSVIRERVLSGVALARAKGTKFGRPCAVDAELEQRILSLRAGGMGIQRIVSATGCGVPRVRRVIREAAAA